MVQRRQYWLFKSEPAVFSFADLRAAPAATTTWDGVRNYQARNYLRTMHVGDQGFFYHSNANPPAVIGIVEIVRASYPDPTQFDSAHAHFDPRSRIAAPAWVMVDIRAIEALARPVSLAELQQEPALAAMQVCQKGSRLSVQPVNSAEWARVLALAKRKMNS